MVQAVVSTPLLQPSHPDQHLYPARRDAPQAPLPLSALVAAQAAEPLVDEESKCLATAVYFESMGEPLEGQLAVAQVVINRSQSGRYPSSWCGVVKQKAQFSFVRAGRFPRIDAGLRSVAQGAGHRAHCRRRKWPIRCRPTCCGIMPIMSRRAGASA